MSWMNVHMCVCSCHILNIYSMVLQVASNNFTSYEMGHLVLSGIDFRCHGFTEFMCGERVEYAWLMQLAFGRVTGAFSTPQVRRPVCLRVCMYMYIYVRGIVCCEHGWEWGVCNICAYVIVRVCCLDNFVHVCAHMYMLCVRAVHGSHTHPLSWGWFH